MAGKNIVKIMTVPRKWRMPFDLERKVVMVIGASSGISLNSVLTLSRPVVKSLPLLAALTASKLYAMKSMQHVVVGLSPLSWMSPPTIRRSM